MDLKKIVFPTDFSPASDKALALAAGLARDSGARVIIVHVEEPPTAYSAGDFAYGLPLTNENVREALDRVIPPGEDIAYEHQMLEGEPARAIIRLAREQGADLIVMGTHGRSGLTRLLMGSVAEGVVRGAPCPVLTVRQPTGEAEEPAGGKQE